MHFRNRCCILKFLIQIKYYNYNTLGPYLYCIDRFTVAMYYLLIIIRVHYAEQNNNVTN